MVDKQENILIVGGGIAGTAAALHVAEAGHRAIIVDKAPVIGGSLPLLDKTFPTDSCGVCFLSPDPPAICPFLECERHQNVTLKPGTTLETLVGEPGKFTATLNVAPRFVDPERCTACGICTGVCPEEGPSDYLGAAWLGETHKAIYQPFSQAIPPTYVIDFALCTRCGTCVPACPYEAIDLEQTPATEVLDVASIILTPGFGPTDASVRGAYGYGKYPNVVTTFEYERMLSTSSPSKGKPIRPSNGEPARKIAFIHCVGSRDLSCDLPYCSAGCCMIAAKQASLTTRRQKDSDVTLFTMDVRAAGRGYRRYVERVEALDNVAYRRSLVSGIKEDPTTHSLTLQYAEDGHPAVDTFDLVVLAVGMSPPEELQAMAERIGVDLNEYGFAHTEDEKPVTTSRAGVYVAGVFREPKDVPATAVEATAAAAAALGNLPMIVTEMTVEAGALPIEDEVPFVGVFLAGENNDLASALDLAALAEACTTLPDVVHVGMQIDPQAVRAAVDEHGINRIVLAGPSARRNGHRREHLNGLPIIEVAIGATDAFVHQAWPDSATDKALGIIGMAVEQLRWVQPTLAERAEPVQRALVLGGDTAAMNAALSLAARGVETHLASPDEAFFGPEALVESIQSEAQITRYFNSKVMAHNGRPGRLHTQLQTTDGDAEIEHGALIVATGAIEHPGDGASMTQSQLTARLASGEAPPASVVMVQCAGDPAFCSKTCCEDALRNALIINEISPETEITVIYRNIITPGFRERLYQATRGAGIRFLRHLAETGPQVDGSTVTVFDDVLGEEIALRPDWIVLSTGVTPREDLPTLADMLQLSLNADGFIAPLNAQSGTLDTNRPGVYLAGLAGGPAFPEELIEQGQAAALRATLFLKRELRAPETVAAVNERICSGCGLCVHVCPYNARTLDPGDGIATVDPLLCEGCGSCVAVCPNGASNQVLMETRGLLNALDEALA